MSIWCAYVKSATASVTRCSGFGCGLHCRAMPPDESDLSREVQEYAVSRLPYMEPALALAGIDPAPAAEGTSDSEPAWNMIEMD